MHAFITVGSTQFDALVDAVLSTAVLDALRERGYSALAIQCGNYEGEHQNIATGADGIWRMYKQEVAVEMWRYRPSLSREFEAADLVISHAGSGTIIDVLRMRKSMVVVPNPTLLDNHQLDLAAALEKLGYLRSSTTRELHECILTFSTTELKSFPERSTDKFCQMLDDEMGF